MSLFRFDEKYIAGELQEGMDEKDMNHKGDGRPGPGKTRWLMRSGIWRTSEYVTVGYYTKAEVDRGECSSPSSPYEGKENELS